MQELDRRAVLATAGSATAAALAGCSILGGAADDAGFDPDAPGTYGQFQYDGANTGHAPYEGPEEPARRWHFTRGERGPAYGIGTPAVANGTVYVAETPADGSGNVVYALDPDDGSVRWSTPVSGPKGPPISVADGVVVVGLPSPVALDPEDGSVVWRAHGELNVQFDLAIDDGTAYAVDFDVREARLVALDLERGRERWSVELAVDLTDTPKVAVADDVVYVGGPRLRAFGTDGRERWTADVGHPVTGAPTVADGRVILPGGTGGDLSAVDLDGDHLWTASVEGSPRVRGSGTLMDSPATDGRYLYVHYMGRTTALQPGDGTVAWTADPLGSGSPVVTDDGVYLAGLQRLVCLAPDSGDRRWSYDSDAEVAGRTAPVPVDGAVFYAVDGLHAIGD